VEIGEVRFHRRADRRRYCRRDEALEFALQFNSEGDRMKDFFVLVGIMFCVAVVALVYEYRRQVKIEIENEGKALAEAAKEHAEEQAKKLWNKL
jgi:aminopeptidase N